MNDFFIYSALGLILVGGFISCAKKPLAPAQEPSAPIQFAQEAKPALDPNEAILPLEPPSYTIYFEFDKYHYSEKEKEKLSNLAAYLKTTGLSVHLSGYASEEGADDYNLFLGEKRCATVRGYLEAWDVPPAHISWVSYGEENPVTHDPDKFYLNRRVEIQIQGVEK